MDEMSVNDTADGDAMQPLQALDADDSARTVSAIVQVLAIVKESCVDARDALKLVNWQEER